MQPFIQKLSFLHLYLHDIEAALFGKPSFKILAFNVIRDQTLFFTPLQLPELFQPDLPCQFDFGSITCFDKVITSSRMTFSSPGFHLEGRSNSKWEDSISSPHFVANSASEGI